MADRVGQEEGKTSKCQRVNAVSSLPKNRLCLRKRRKRVARSFSGFPNQRRRSTKRVDRRLWNSSEAMRCGVRIIGDENSVESERACLGDEIAWKLSQRAWGWGRTLPLEIFLRRLTYVSIKNSIAPSVLGYDMLCFIDMFCSSFLYGFRSEHSFLCKLHFLDLLFNIHYS